MSMAGSSNILRSSTEFHSETSLMNHFTSIGRHDVNTQDLVYGTWESTACHIPVFLSVRILTIPSAESFARARLEIDAYQCSIPVGLEGERTLLVLHSFLLQLIFSLTDRSELGGSVDDLHSSLQRATPYTRNHIVVDMTLAILDDVHSLDAFFFSLLPSIQFFSTYLVSKHWTTNSITNSIDVREFGSEILINENSSSLVHLQMVLKSEHYTSMPSSLMPIFAVLGILPTQTRTVSVSMVSTFLSTQSSHSTNAYPSHSPQSE